MSDQRTRSLERTDSLSARVTLLVDRRRSGDISAAVLRLRAYCGDEAARHVSHDWPWIPDEKRDGSSNLGEWLRTLATLAPEEREERSLPGVRDDGKPLGARVNVGPLRLARLAAVACGCIGDEGFHPDVPAHLACVASDGIDQTDEARRAKICAAVLAEYP